MRVVAAGVAALAAFASAAPAYAAYRPQLLVTGSQLAFSQAVDDDATAKVAITVPSDYRISTGQPPGTVLGAADAHVTVRGFDVGAIAVSGRIVAGNPAQYAAAQVACGAGSLEAVWLMELSAQGQSFAFPVFVERTGGVVRLLVCFPSPDVPEAQGGAPFGVKLVSAVLTLPGLFGAPQRSGRFAWSGLFTPYVRGTATAGTTVEARAIVPVPYRLTLRFRLVGPRRNAALLNGQLTEAGAHPSGVRLELYAATSTKANAKVTRVATARTRKGGRFSFRRGRTRTLWYAVLVQPRDTTARDCGGSSAPGGCLSALVAPASSRFVKVARRR